MELRARVLMALFLPLAFTALGCFLIYAHFFLVHANPDDPHLELVAGALLFLAFPLSLLEQRVKRRRSEQRRLGGLEQRRFRTEQWTHFLGEIGFDVESEQGLGEQRSWSQDAGYRELLVSRQLHGGAYEFAVELKLPGELTLTTAFGAAPPTGSGLRLAHLGGFVEISGSTAGAVLRLGLEPASEALRTFAEPALRSRRPWLRLETGKLVWAWLTTPSLEEYEAALKQATQAALKIEDSVGASIPDDLLEIVLGQDVDLRYRSLAALLAEFPASKQAKVARNVASSSSDDGLRLLVELERENPRVGVIADLLSGDGGDEIPSKLRARAKAAIGPERSGSLMMEEASDHGELSLTAEGDGALSRPES